MSESGYVVVVTCVVLRKDQGCELQALILKRGDEESEGPGLWTIPGGKVIKDDWGDPIRTPSGYMVWPGVLSRAMAREIFEETGIETLPENLIYLQGGDVVFVRKNGVPTLVVTYALFYEGNPKKVRLDKSATAYKWVREEELPAHPCIGDVAERITETFFECAQVLAMR